MGSLMGDPKGLYRGDGHLVDRVDRQLRVVIFSRFPCHARSSALPATLLIDRRAGPLPRPVSHKKLNSDGRPLWPSI
jgi:hypothetical protein